MFFFPFPARDDVFQDDLQADLDRKAAELTSAQERIQALEEEGVRIAAELDAARAELDRLHTLEPELAAAKEHGDALQARVTELEAEVAEAKQSLEDADTERKAIERKHAGVVRNAMHAKGATQAH